ncbi:amidohydrolase family protein [Deinococcus alpinitundrae]|uniref:amidohydrolase family protein n=1 Tax=Deinococcus alpinitundrae TaxID=468913 RepID=UPI00137A9748|nr:amidohydrolase family protein [Deinococcus alpinitundrae]
MDTLEHIPFYDHHAHALYHEALWRAAPLGAYFTEAYDPVIQQRFAQDTLFFRRSMRDLGELYGCEPTAEAITDTRLRHDYAELCAELLSQANIQHLLIDDGFWPERLWSVEESRARLPLPVRRVVRIENELEKLLAHHDTSESLLSALDGILREAGQSAAGFKSIIAYRTGLDIASSSVPEQERSFERARREGGQLNEKSLLDAALLLGLRIAAELRLPVQFHTGYGDPDLDMRLANPLHLRSVIERPELADLKVVLLHCYPYVREAGYLASVYRGVHLDLGLTVPYTSVASMRGAFREALHLSPVSKVLISSDAQRTPELYWLAARWARRSLGQALRQTVEDGDLSSAESQWAAERILWHNANELYAR